MRVTLVHVHVKPEHVQEFAEATRKNHAGSVREAGNLRFDVLQSADDPGRFILYEVFRSDEDVELHKKTPHYLAWRKAVDGWMASPREGKPYRLLAPEGPAE